MERRQALALLLACIVALSASTGCLAADASDLPAADEGVTSGHQTQTDITTHAAQADVPSHKERSFRDKAEKFEFQAEVNRLMDILIHSLYSNKDIFLRELISNAADALDKIRFLSLTDKSVLGEGDNANLEIKISVDKEKKVLTIRDRGVGMTKKELVDNLGTIAKSGTSAFLEQMQKGGDINLIGQFGVGFYSVYLVADYVEVISKHNDDKQWIWESNADGSFAVSEDVNGEPLGRGTQINIYLKDETQEYAEEFKLKELVTKYSEFIDFPIYLYTSKEVEVEAPEEEDAEGTTPLEDKEDQEEKEEDAANADEAEDVEDDTEDEEEEEEPKKKMIKKTEWEWVLLNDAKALWLRNPAEVDEEEYEKFYTALTKGAGGKPVSYAHFKAEGDVEFKAILYIPDKAPHDFLDTYYSKKPSLKLYVRRVFISDEFEDLIPRYLSFLVGLVDSDTLPLSVSRETLQAHAALKTIKKKLVRKALDMIKKMADAETRGDAEDDTEDTDDESTKEEAKKYATFWGEFGKALKLGIIEDASNRGRLAKLLRFKTSKSPDELTSLEDYVSRMKEGQKTIYYLAGTSQSELAKSPFVEQLVAKGYEVIYFTDAVDEYMMQNMKDYEDHPFQNASKEDLKLDGKDSKGKKAMKQLKDQFKELVKWWKDTLAGSDVESVKVSTRLATTPCVVVTSKYGWSANMERIMRAQALQDSDKQMYMKGRKILEINPRHPLIVELKNKYEAEGDSEQAKALATLLFETALLESGFQVENPKDFNTRVYELMKGALNIQGDLSVPQEADDEVEDTEAAEESKRPPATSATDQGVASPEETAAEEVSAAEAEAAEESERPPATSATDQGVASPEETAAEEVSAAEAKAAADQDTKNEL
jgi:heat shock protein beta